MLYIIYIYIYKKIIYLTNTIRGSTPPLIPATYNLDHILTPTIQCFDPIIKESQTLSPSMPSFSNSARSDFLLVVPQCHNTAHHRLIKTEDRCPGLKPHSCVAAGEGISAHGTCTADHGRRRRSHPRVRVTGNMASKALAASFRVQRTAFGYNVINCICARDDWLP